MSAPLVHPHRVRPHDRAHVYRVEVACSVCRRREPGRRPRTLALIEYLPEHVMVAVSRKSSRKHPGVDHWSRTVWGVLRPEQKVADLECPACRATVRVKRKTLRQAGDDAKARGLGLVWADPEGRVTL